MFIDCSWFFIHVQSFSLLFNDQKWWISLLFDHKIAEHLCISHHLMVRHLLHLSTGASMKQPDEGWWKTWPKVGEAEISGTHFWNSMGNLELLGGAGCAHLEKWWSSWSSSMGFGWHPFSMKWKIIHSCLKPPNRWLIIWLILVSWCCYSQYMESHKIPWFLKPPSSFLLRDFKWLQVATSCASCRWNEDLQGKGWGILDWRTLAGTACRFRAGSFFYGWDGSWCPGYGPGVQP